MTPHARAFDGVSVTRYLSLRLTSRSLGCCRLDRLQMHAAGAGRKWAPWREVFSGRSSAILSRRRPTRTVSANHSPSLASRHVLDVLRIRTGR